MLFPLMTSSPQQTAMPSYYPKALLKTQANQTTYTFSGADIKETANTRLLLMYIFHEGGQVINSVTVDGVTAASLGLGDATPKDFEVWTAALTAGNGATGSIIVQFAAGMENCTITPVVVEGLNSYTPVDTDKGSVSSSSISGSIDTQDDGLLFVGIRSANTPIDWTWPAGFTEIFADGNIEGGRAGLTVAVHEVATGQSGLGYTVPASTSLFMEQLGVSLR